MRQILTSIFLLLAIGLVHGQSSKPTFLIKLNDSINCQDFELISDKFSEIFIDRGFIPFHNDKMRHEKKADLNVYITYKNSGDSIVLALEIIEKCWNTTIASSRMVEKITSNKSDNKKIISEVADSIFPKLMDYYTEMAENGRIIKLTIKSLVELDTLIETKNGMKKLEDILIEFIESKSVDKPQIFRLSSFEIAYKMRIPMRNEEGKLIGIKSIAYDFKDFLKSVPLKNEFQYLIKSDYEILIEI